jgi:hypothetical protein
MDEGVAKISGRKRRLATATEVSAVPTILTPKRAQGMSKSVPITAVYAVIAFASRKRDPTAS